MAPRTLVRRLRGERQLSLRALAERAGTSHATLSAYEHGRVSPTLGTVERISRACGVDVEPRLTRRVTEADGLARGDELVAVLRLAASFPARHADQLGRERFPA